MRNVKRIKPFCDNIAKLWGDNLPDWRFGQLMSNFFGWLFETKKVDLFFPEENAMLEYFKEFIESVKPTKDFVKEFKKLN